MVFFFIGYAVFIAGLLGYSAHVSVSCPDAAQRKDAYRVLRLVWFGGTSVAAVVALASHLHELGVLR